MDLTRTRCFPSLPRWSKFMVNLCAVVGARLGFSGLLGGLPGWMPSQLPARLAAWVPAGLGCSLARLVACRRHDSGGSLAAWPPGGQAGWNDEPAATEVAASP